MSENDIQNNLGPLMTSMVDNLGNSNAKLQLTEAQREELVKRGIEPDQIINGEPESVQTYGVKHRSINFAKPTITKPVEVEKKPYNNEKTFVFDTDDLKGSFGQAMSDAFKVFNVLQTENEKLQNLIDLANIDKLKHEENVKEALEELDKVKQEMVELQEQLKAEQAANRELAKEAKQAKASHKDLMNKFAAFAEKDPAAARALLAG